MTPKNHYFIIITFFYSTKSRNFSFKSCLRCMRTKMLLFQSNPTIPGQYPFTKTLTPRRIFNIYMKWVAAWSFRNPRMVGPILWHQQRVPHCRKPPYTKNQTILKILQWVTKITPLCISAWSFRHQNVKIFKIWRRHRVPRFKKPLV